MMSLGTMSGIGAMVILATLLLAATLEAQPATRPAPPPPGPKNPALPTLWIIGDSTVRVGTPQQQGWGDPIADFFDETKINVVNRAIGGRSSRSFRNEGRWQQILDQLRPGDFVLMQFGHNDGGALAGDNRERGSIRGTGDETEEVTLTLEPRKGQTEVVHSFGWYMRQYVREARAKGATPIVVTLIPRCPRPGATIAPATQPQSYQLWAIQVAEQEDAPLIDLHDLIWSEYVRMTPEQIKQAYFCEADFTHTSPAGARFNAGKVVEGIRALSDGNLKDHLRATPKAAD
jgi:lysophospholipase L1-like esterase